MKKLLVALVVGAFLFSGCGLLERGLDNSNYESLSNEKGDLKLYDGGELIATYPNSKIIYSSADTNAVFFEDENGNEKYWQGTMLMDIN